MIMNKNIKAAGLKSYVACNRNDLTRAIYEILKNYDNIELLIKNGKTDEYLKNVETINTAFLKESIGKYLDAESKKTGNFKDNIDIINSFLEQQNFKASTARIYFLALAMMAVDFNGNAIEPVIDHDTVKYRLIALARGESFTYIVADKETSKKIFAKKLIGLEEARRIYGDKFKQPMHEFVIAGGDATRFLLLFEALAKRMADHQSTSGKMILDDADFAEMQRNPDYKDIKKLFNTETIKQIFELPIYNFINMQGNLELPKVNNDGNFLVSELKFSMDEVLKRTSSLPKAMVYSLEHIIGKDKFFTNYFMIKILRAYLTALEKQATGGNHLYFMVKDQTTINALKEGLKYLIDKEIISEKVLKVHFMDRPWDALPITKNGNLIFNDQGDVLQTSTGHGLALIKGVNEVMKINNGRPAAISVQTIDNCGVDVFKYTAIAENGCHVENKLRKELIEILFDERAEDKETIEKIKDLFERNFIDASKYDLSSENLASTFAQFISDRWDFVLDPAGKQKNQEYVIAKKMDVNAIFDKIKELPITIAIVVSPEPGQTGGGLYVSAENESMAVVDKFKFQNAEQEKNEDYAFYFNPMLYAMYTVNPLPPEFEEGSLFLANKKNYIQAESASTHLATNPQRVLKRIVSVPSEELKQVFQQNKTIDETHKDKLQDIHDQIQRDVEHLGSLQRNNVNERPAIEDMTRYVFGSFFHAQALSYKKYLEARNIEDLEVSDENSMAENKVLDKGKSQSFDQGREK